MKKQTVITYTKAEEVIYAIGTVRAGGDDEPTPNNGHRLVLHVGEPPRFDVIEEKGHDDKVVFRIDSKVMVTDIIKAAFGHTNVEVDLQLVDDRTVS